MSAIVGRVRILMLEDSDLDAALVERELARSELKIDCQRVSARAPYAQALQRRAAST